MVLIASVDAHLRRRWCRGLQGRFSIHEVEGRGGLERGLEEMKPSLLLLDLALPGLGGVEGLPALQGLSPMTRILLFADPSDGMGVLSALKAGARGYCHKDIDPSLLKFALQVIKRGEVWVAPTFLAPLLEEVSSVSNGKGASDGERHLGALTAREREIARLIGEGACNKEIGVRLNVAESTVKAHLTTIFRKLGLMDRLQLALFVRAGEPGLAVAARGGRNGLEEMGRGLPSPQRRRVARGERPQAARRMSGKSMGYLGRAAGGGDRRKG